MTNNENQVNTIFTEEELIQQILNLKGFVDEAKVQLEQAQQRIADLEKDKTDLTTERDNALDTLQTEKVNHEATQEKLKTTETDRDNLQKEFDEVSEERNNLKDEKTKKTATMEKAKVGMDELTAQILELRTKAINLNKK